MLSIELYITDPRREEYVMKIKQRIMQVAAILLLNVSVNVYADSWNCSHDDLVREVIVAYPQGGSVPCDVVYKKQTEGVEDQVLWSAESEEGFCEEKARGLVAKLESSGWVCLETVSAESAAQAGAEAEVEAETQLEADAEAELETEAGSE
jgi:hypothetical protein